MEKVVAVNIKYPDSNSMIHYHALFYYGYYIHIIYPPS